MGTINLAKSEPSEEFLQEDEETLVMFASQVALVIANARRYREEQRARKRPGDPDKHLPGWRRCFRCEDRRAALVQ